MELIFTEYILNVQLLLERYICIHIIGTIEKCCFFFVNLLMKSSQPLWLIMVMPVRQEKQGLHPCLPPQTGEAVCHHVSSTANGFDKPEPPKRATCL